MPPEGRDSTPLAGTDKQASSATDCGEELARQKKQIASTSTAWIARHPPFILAVAECATIAMSSDGNRVREPASSKFENSVSGDGCQHDPTSLTILERSSKQPGQADQIHLQPHSHCLPLPNHAEILGMDWLRWRKTHQFRHVTLRKSTKVNLS
jgi:hypothetical protein